VAWLDGETDFGRPVIVWNFMAGIRRL